MATIQGVYVALFGRPADPTGLAYFNGVTNNGANLTAINNLAGQSEYTARFTGMNNVQIVNSIYQSLFNRDAEPTGLNFFVDALNKGTLNINNIAIAILDGAQGTDATIRDAKIASANAFTAAIDTPVEAGAYVGLNAAAQGRAFLADVTTTAKTTAQADAALAKIVVDGAAGATINLVANTAEELSLTKGILNGTTTLFTTNLNDTINGDATNWQPATDKVDGGLGTDTFNGTVAADAVLTADSLKNVEILNLKATTISNITVTAAAQLTQVWNNASTAALTVTGASATTTLGLKGAIAEDTTFAFASVAGTNTANVALDGAVVTAAKAVNIAGTEVVNITNSGTSTVGTLTLDAGQTVNIAGSGTLTLGVVSTATVESINASSFTGSLSINAGLNDGLKTLTSGSGADTIVVDTTHTNDLTVNAGAGTDIITVLADAAASTKAISLTGGAGSDIFQFGSDTARLDNVGVGVTNSAQLNATLVTITDFNKAEDLIRVNDGAVGAAAAFRDTIAPAEQGFITAASDLFAAVSKAAEFTSVGTFSTFQYGSDSYIFVNNGGAGLDAGDGLVKLTGVAAADLTASNLVIS